MELLLAQVTTPSAGSSTGFLVIQGLSAVVGLVSIVCWILVLVKMFQNGQTGLGIVSICCGIIAFIVGWMNASQWGIKNVMMIWTAMILLGIILNIAAAAMGFSMMPSTTTVR
jgi:hypothetical protein